MRLLLFGNTLIESDSKEELEAFRRGLFNDLVLLNREYKLAYGKRLQDTDEDYFHALEQMAPKAYEILCRFKDYAGDRFAGYLFDGKTQNTAGIKIHLNVEKGYHYHTLNSIAIDIAFGLNMDCVIAE